jgi:hypothetical protein
MNMKKCIGHQWKKIKALFLGGIALFMGGNLCAQGFTTPGVANTTTPIFVNGTGLPTPTGIYIGRGANQNAISTAVGVGALANSAGGAMNTAFGNAALQNSTIGLRNTAIGNRALMRSISPTSSDGNDNIAIGDETMSGSATVQNTGSNNVAIGNNALHSNSTGVNNTAIGFNSMVNSTNNFAFSNCAIGHSSLANVTGSRNTAIGASAFQNLTSGSNNIGIGQNVIPINPAGDNQLVIGTTIYGTDIYSNTLVQIGIGQFSAVDMPSARLDINGNLRIRNVPPTTVQTNYLVVDGLGFVRQAPIPSQGISSNCATVSRVPLTTNVNGNVSCSQIYDNSNSVSSSLASVGIGPAYNGVSPNFSFTYPGSHWYEGSSLPSSSGNVRLAVDGVVEGLAYYAYSDKRLKSNIKTVENSISKIKKLRGVTYTWDKDIKSGKSLNDIPQLGFLAQEVEKVIPEAVIVNADGFYAMNYSTIIPVLTEGIKEQQTEIETQQLKIENLELQITELKNKLNQLVPGDVKIKINSLEVVPNPITGTSVVSYKLDNSNAVAFLIVSDLQGKLLKQISLPRNQQQGQVQVSKSDLPSGMYVFAIISGNTEVQSKKVLVSASE